MIGVRDDQPLSVERSGAAIRLVLSHPAGLLGSQLSDALKSAQRDPDARCVILTGDAFDAGDRDADESALAELTTAIGLLRTMPLPSFALVSGDVSGTGGALLLACDLRFAPPEATLTLSSVARTGAPDIGLAWDLLRLLGRTRTFDLLYSGRSVTATEAHKLGLLTSVAAPQELGELVDAVVTELASHSRRALAAAKRSVTRAEEVGFDESVEFDFLLAVTPPTPDS